MSYHANGKKADLMLASVVENSETFKRFHAHRANCPKWKAKEHCSDCGYGLVVFAALVLEELGTNSLREKISRDMDQTLPLHGEAWDYAKEILIWIDTQKGLIF